MITTTAWVPRGFSAPFPQKYDFNDQEFERIAELARLQLDDAQEDLEDAQDESNEAATGESSTQKDGATEGKSDKKKKGKGSKAKKEYVGYVTS